jgi:hypothetical protein
MYLLFLNGLFSSFYVCKLMRRFTLELQGYWAVVGTITFHRLFIMV